MVKTSLDRYRLVRSLGSGSQAESFLACLVDAPEQLVVIKVMHSHLLHSADHRRQMELEVRALSRLSHPYIVRLIESRLSDPEAPSLVMEYVRGVTLADDLARCRRLNVTDAAWVAGCVCHALDYAHARGVVHRDLRPANILRCDPGTPDESIRVMDFGYAALVDRPHISTDRLTGSGLHRSVGTHAYVAPEQLLGEPVDHRSDFYSLGIVLFRMLTGYHPFPYAETEQVLRAQLGQKLPTFASLRAFDLPPRLEELVGRCLSKHPADRPGTGQELADELSRAIGYDVREGTRPHPNADDTSENADGGGRHPETPTEIRLPEAIPPMDALSSVYYFDAWLPEALAVMKLQGFLSEFGGRLLSSEPGTIRLRVGRMPSGGFVGRLLVSGRPEPVDIDLGMEKTSTRGNLLRLTVHFHPPTGYRVRRPQNWRLQCDYLYRDLSAYLMARN